MYPSETTVKTDAIRRLTFEAGHRVYGHESKCAALHGHSYKVEIEASAPSLDGLGRVIDFSVLKERIGTWIDENWDHATILHERDPLGDILAHEFQKVFVLPYNPTAENIGRYLVEVVGPEELADTNVTVTAVIIYETENCKVRVSL